MQKVEYTSIEIDKGESIEAEVLKELGQRGYRLVLALPTTREVVADDARYDSVEPTFQLIFMREEPSTC